MAYANRKMMNLLLITLMSLFSVSLISAQEENTVPDVTGLTIPEAAAVLNAAGYGLGSQTASPQAGEGLVPGTVVDQSVPGGMTSEPGTRIDLTILSNARVTLIYDGNDLTMINQAGSVIDLNGLVFGSSDGSKRYLATNWRGTLDNGDCTQVWSIARRAAKDVEGCASTFWLTTNNPDNHFWTQAAGVDSFVVTQNNQQLATCDAAPANSENAPLTCEFFVITNTLSADNTEYIYFAYTRDQFAVINTSETAWMPLTETPIYNFNPQISIPGATVILGDQGLFRNPETVADVTRLAPGQCVMLTLAPLTDAPALEGCDLIAQRELDPSVAFWLAPFELNSPLSLEGRATCPAASETRLTRCIMPR
ncbi:MAG: PASTA domain-containing protein [Anaerolineae bacterium]